LRILDMQDQGRRYPSQLSVVRGYPLLLRDVQADLDLSLYHCSTRSRPVNPVFGTYNIRPRLSSRYVQGGSTLTSPIIPAVMALIPDPTSTISLPWRLMTLREVLIVLICPWTCFAGSSYKLCPHPSKVSGDGREPTL
jgi:hypothetical protein